MASRISTTHSTTTIPATTAATATPTAATGTPSSKPRAPLSPLAPDPDPDGAPPSVLVDTTTVPLRLVCGAVLVLPAVTVVVAVTVTTESVLEAEEGAEEVGDAVEEGVVGAEVPAEDPAVTVTVTETVVVPDPADVGEPVVQTGGIPEVIDVLLTGKLVGSATDVPAYAHNQPDVRCEGCGDSDSPTCLHASMRKDWPAASSVALQASVMQFTASAMKFGW